MSGKDPRAEMPFLEHLEELRWRILWSLSALIIGTLIGFWLVQTYDVLNLLKQPIAPYLPNGKLFVVRPTDAFVLTLKLAFVVGAVLAAPIVVWQTWAFLSPALYEREKRYVAPVVVGGFVLFGTGAVMAYFWVLPAAFKFLFAFQSTDLESIITADAYFSFATQLILAFGISFELPLVVMILATFGLVTPEFLAKNRRFAVVAIAILAALITPTTDAVSMSLMMVPLILLYEVGIILARLVRKRPEPSTVALWILVAALSALGSPGRAQERPRPDSTYGQGQRPDSAAVGGAIDTAAARRMGLPTGPSRTLPAEDSTLSALLGRPKYRATRYGADSLTFHADTKEIDLTGSALVEREGSTLEADTVAFAQAQCQIEAIGRPKLFDAGTVLVGEGMTYDTCTRRGIVAQALTKFNQSGVEWFLRGHLAIDSASTRIYAGGSSVTSSDLPLPDYHFAAGRVKWVTNTIMVARPAVLYVRDVPVMWLPFIFQDMRRGRRSGMLVPRFGFNDLVRPNRGYRRHVSDIGYYFAINDYLDLQTSIDWYAGRYVSVNGEVRYRWLERFVNGGISFSRIFESGEDGGPGGRSLRLLVNHQQSFNQRTRLSASIDFASSARVVQRNTVDPFLATANLRSTLNFNKQFGWGAFSLGGSRSQDLTNGVITRAFPNMSVTPVTINFSDAITWSPSLSLSSDKTSHQFGGLVASPPANGLPREDTVFVSNSTFSMRAATPIRVGRWNWPNDFSVQHFITDRRSTLTLRDSTDSTRTTTRFYGEDFNTTVDWNTSIGLPSLFASSWKLQPSVGIQNSTSGAFMVRNRYTNGDFVRQGKRLSFGASLSPTLFGLFPGIGPLARIRHSISPFIHWGYAPAAGVPEAYARAVNPDAPNLSLRSPATHNISFGLSQNFEGKFKAAPGDTNSAQPAQARKIKLLSLQTSAIEYDFEQAKMAGRTGWRTQTINNQFTSDLLPGFSVATTHDLWKGAVGYDTTQFSPFLSRVSARFSLSGRTIGGLIGLLTGRPSKNTAPTGDTTVTTNPLQGPQRSLGPAYRRADQVAGAYGGSRQFTASVTYDDARPRQPATTLGSESTNRTLGLQFAFAPSANWTVSWNTQYNMTTNEFGQHVVRLDRDLRRWHATFSFVKAPNGNFAFNFFINLIDQPELKFQYDQQTVRR